MQSPGFYGWKLLAVFWIVTFINLGFPAYGQTVINSLMANPSPGRTGVLRAKAEAGRNDMSGLCHDLQA